MYFVLEAAEIQKAQAQNDAGSVAYDEDIETAESESQSERPKHRGDPGVIDLITPLAGILLWIIDIGTDIYVAHKAYRDYGTAWGHTLSFLLVSSVIVIYGVHLYVPSYTTNGICSSIKAYPVLLFGPPGR